MSIFCLNKTYQEISLKLLSVVIVVHAILLSDFETAHCQQQEIACFVPFLLVKTLIHNNKFVHHAVRMVVYLYNENNVFTSFYGLDCSKNNQDCNPMGKRPVRDSYALPDTTFE